MQHTTAADMTDRTADSAGMNSPRAGAGRTSGAKNNHPTVKPIQLMRYLCKLVTPPNGLILDPFTGSGSTGVAATLEGFNFMGAEMDEHNCHIANTRINYALRETGVTPMITLIEYDADSKPTGRLCRLPDMTRESLPDTLMLYGILAFLDNGQLRGYHPTNWCFAYQSGMGFHPGEHVELTELLS